MSPAPKYPLFSIPISVGVGMIGRSFCLQGAEEWTPNKVIKAERVTLTQIAAVILMDRSILMTPRFHLDKLSVLTALLSTDMKKTLLMTDQNLHLNDN